MTQPPKTPPKPRRSLLWWLPALLALPVLAVLALPRALSTLPGRDWLLGRANRALAPGMLRLDSIRFSWFGPTRMTRFLLTSADGRPVATAPSATWDRNLFQILFERPKLGTLRLDDAALDVTRAPDGSIDLYEVLRPVIGLDPKTSARIVVSDGRLRVRGAGLAEPVEAEHAGVDLVIRPRPGLITWRVRLANGDAEAPRNTLDVDGRLDRTGAPGDLGVHVLGRDWPLAFGGHRGTASGRLDGTISAQRKAGRWTLSGAAALAQAAASGPGPNGRGFAIDRVKGTWDADLAARTCVIRAFELTSPAGTLKAGGTVAAGGKVRFDGEADLAGLATSAGAGADGLRARWSAEGTVATAADGAFRVDGGVVVNRIGGGPGEGEPVKVRVRASAPAGGGRIDLAELGLESRFVGLTASGSVDDPEGRRVVDLTGKVAPDWETINAWLAQHVEPGARVSGRDRAFRIKGALAEGGAEALEGEVGLALDSADVYGMKLGPAAVVIRRRAGKVAIDPIDTTVNGGRLHLEPEFRARDGANPAAVVLGAGTRLTDAEVNDEVSRRVLSYVAPVLDHATRVRGRVSATITRADFPLGGAGPTVDGAVVFQGVEFVPAGWLDALFGLIGREGQSVLKLDEPVALTIADRRVYQRGLTVPIGNLSKVEVEGWVGFDRALHLTASVPVLPTMLADRPILGALAADARVRVPIRGTLRQPEIDREAFKLGMKEMARSLAERGGVLGAAGLLERLTRPRDPDAPPPPTPEERRERRQERRAERQMRRRGELPE